MKKRIFIRAGLLSLLIPAAGGFATDDSGSVVVVYNSRMDASREVAEHYAAARDIPEERLLGFPMSRNIGITRKEFRAQIEHPLLSEVEKRGWLKFAPLSPEADPMRKKREGLRKLVEADFRYLVLCHGVPVRIEKDANLLEEGEESLPKPMRRNEAAVDSELAVLPLTGMQFMVAGPLRNPLYTITNSFRIHPTNGVLMVSRLDGPTPEIAKGLVDKALQAEKEGLWGRAYFDTRDVQDEQFKVGDQWIGRAAEICRKAGLEVTLDKDPALFGEAFPMSHIAIYAGWYSEHVGGHFALPEVEFVPGAFAYHLHSFSGAQLRNPKLQWMGPLLSKGATVSMGSVTEPYLGGTPDIATFMGRFVFLGFSFGEAAYASQNSLSWMTTVVGDPLYRPFSRHPNVQHTSVLREKSPKLEWSLLRLVNLNLAAGKEIEASVRFLRDEPEAAESAVLQEKLGDLLALAGKKEEAVEAFDRARKLNPSKQQGTRIHLRLAGLLEQLGQRKRAANVLEDLLERAPDYADAEGVRKRIKESRKE